MDNAEKPKDTHRQGENCDGEGLYGSDLHDLPPDLVRVAQRYGAQPVPRPTLEQTARMVARLVTEESAIRRAEPCSAPSALLALQVARWRARLLGPWFWAATVMLITLGTVLALINTVAGNALTLILMLPLTGILSLAYAVRTTSSGLREVEAAAAVGVVEVAAGLALAILGFDCAFGILITFILALLQWAPFVALLVAWLGPLLLLAGLSLPIALRWGMTAALVVCAGPWVALALAAIVWPHTLPAQLFALPTDQLALMSHIAAAAIGACVLLLFLLRGSVWQRFLIATSRALSF